MEGDAEVHVGFCYHFEYLTPASSMMTAFKPLQGQGLEGLDLLLCRRFALYIEALLPWLCRSDTFICAEADPSEFPGPKAWPLFVSTGAFFSMLAFLESFQYLS